MLKQILIGTTAILLSSTAFADSGRDNDDDERPSRLKGTIWKGTAVLDGWGVGSIFFPCADPATRRIFDNCDPIPIGAMFLNKENGVLQMPSVASRLEPDQVDPFYGEARDFKYAYSTPLFYYDQPTRSTYQLTATWDWHIGQGGLLLWEETGQISNGVMSGSVQLKEYTLEQGDPYGPGVEPNVIYQFSTQRYELQNPYK